MLELPWIFGIPQKKARYQPEKYCTYWQVMASYKNWNIIHLTPISTPFETFDMIHQVIVDSKSDNMA